MQNIVITGGSKGIGSAVAKHFARSGDKVYALARSADKLQSLADEFPGYIIPLPADLTDEEATRSVIEDKLAGKQIHILINNAGALVNKPFLQTTDSDWNLMLEVNLLSASRLIRILHPQLKGGHIVNISSMGGFLGSSKFPGLAAYSASKGALSILSECLAVEFLDDGITVNSLCLGAVQTEMLEQAFPGFNAPLNPDEMAAFIYDFSKNGHRFFNGKVLPVSLQDPT
jgi:NAD(P)-dependent dehydrogenase (short-subunit alcohol dehydrogenase family)